MKKTISILLLLGLLSINYVRAQTITAINSGNWGNIGNWDLNRLPADGDTIIIPGGVVISVESGTTYNLQGPNTTIIVVNDGGELNGNGFVPIFQVIELNSGDGDKVIVENGGLINPELTISYDGVPIRITNLGGGIFGDPTIEGPTIIENGVVPVELLFFSAKKVNQQVELTWATASEENFDYFSIERSTDGENFSEIGRVDGMGESAERVDYDYLDEFPIEGVSYYRLRSIDFDGYTEIFDYKMVEVIGVRPDFHIYPNPIEDGKFSLQTNFEIGSDAQLMVYNSMGGIEMNLDVNNWLTYHYLQG